jgi:hypothetical protein
MCDVSKRANLKPNSGDLLAGYLAVMSIVLLIAVFVVFRSCSGIEAFVQNSQVVNQTIQ